MPPEGLVNVKVSGILFDVGGVLVELDGMPALAGLMESVDAPGALHERWMASASVASLETGKISASQFAAGVVVDLNLPVSPDAFLENFSNWPKAVHPGVFELLEAIPSTYRVAALSNTSAVHWEKVTAMGLAARFEMTFLSHEIGYLKPAPEAYGIALAGMGLPPGEVLFLDDGQPNVDAAKSLGLHAHLVRSPEDARAVLERYGVLPDCAGSRILRRIR